MEGAPMEIAHVMVPPVHGETTCWISALFVKEGQPVVEGQRIGRLESADQFQDLFSPQSGYIVGLHAVPGQTVHPGDVLCYICSQPSVQPSAAGQHTSLTSHPGFDPRALIVYGGGGHGKTVIDLIRALGMYRIVGIIDDGLPEGSEVLDVPVIGGADDLPEWNSRGVRLAVNAVGGIGNVNVRLKVFDLLSRSGFFFPAIIHPSAVVERSAVVEAGAQIFAHAYVGSAARVGFGTVVNTGAIVHHDCVIGQVVNLSPGATLAGHVRVEDHAQIGMLATVNIKVTVGRGARLGNGCTVKGDVPPGGRVYAGAIWPEPRRS